MDLDRVAGHEVTWTNQSESSLVMQAIQVLIKGDMNAE